MSAVNTTPPHRIETCIPELREPGMMVFNIRPGGIAENQAGANGWFVGVSRDGEIKLNLNFDAPSQDVRRLKNGNLLVSLTSAGRILEVTRDGEVVRQWHVAGKWLDKRPPEDSTEIDLPLTHHTINLFPNGNLMLLSAEMRQFDNWPANDSDADAERITANVIGDIILEVMPNGTIVRKWKMLDILDPYRLSYGSCSGYWKLRGFENSNDWCHTNSVTYDDRDNCLIASLRTQDCLVKFSATTGEIKWILGDPGNWKAPWADKLLEPVGKVEWQYHQHDVSVTPSGTILCFDNGNYRALPFASKMPDEVSYSRGVEFAVDEEAMTVQQVWSYGSADGDNTFACYQGGAYRLPQTGNTFLTYGGVCTKEGVPTSNNADAFARARLVEITPDGKVVFDLWIDSDENDGGAPLSSFRAEHFPG
ncbi:MAG: aryl-sulfate sulfotransferase [Pseudomonadota bacterium]|nr:aryl-sulfate sulfotransferase [Pseudomonadota bacterium]